MSNITCYLQATNNRQQFLKPTIESINKQTIFTEKIIQVSGHGDLNNEIYTLLKNTDWIISQADLSRESAFKAIIEQATGSYVFYIEDDIDIHYTLSPIPEILDKYLPGLLSLNLGGSLCDHPHNYGDLLDAKHRVFHYVENSDLVVFTRDIRLKNDYYFEFPCLFMSKEMLSEMLPKIRPSLGNIEMTLSDIYCTLDTEKYFKCAMCQHSFLQKIAEGPYPIKNFMYEMEKAKMYRLLDPNQGGVQWNLDLLK